MIADLLIFFVSLAILLFMFLDFEPGFTVNKCREDGCSGQLCVDVNSPPVASTCEWRCEYGCYKHAECDKVDGKCQWIPNDEYNDCLNKCEEKYKRLNL